MAKTRVPGRPRRAQSIPAAAAAEGLHQLKTAQAAAWLLHQLHVGDWHSPEALAPEMDSVASRLTPEDLRTHLGYIAIGALIDELDSVRDALEQASVPPAVA